MDHVDDAAELEHEEAGVVRRVGLQRGQQVDRPHVQVLLAPRPRPELDLGAEHLGAVQRLEVAAEADVLLLLQRVLDDADVVLGRDPGVGLVSLQHARKVGVEEGRGGGGEVVQVLGVVVEAEQDGVGLHGPDARDPDELLHAAPDAVRQGELHEGLHLEVVDEREPVVRLLRQRVRGGLLQRAQGDLTNQR